MINIIYKKNKKYLFAVILICINVSTIIAQNKAEKVFDTQKWGTIFGIGINAFTSRGIPQSRNQINYFSTHPDQSFRSNTGIETGLITFVYDMKLQRKIGKKNYVGILLNVYKDREERSHDNQTVQSIRDDSMKILSIYTNQSYVNLGIGYEREFFSTPSKRFSFSASVYTGVSFNRTPERTEYDYYDSTNYILIKKDNNNKEWRLVSTSFKNGYFVNPSVKIKYYLWKNHGVITELSYLYQWHQYSQHINIEGDIGTMPRIIKNYSVEAFQIKTCYFF